MLSARYFGFILALCAIIRVLPDLTFEYKDIICPYSHVKCRFKASDAFFLEKHGPFIRRSRASRYFAGRVQYSTNGVSTFQIHRDLLVCSDISSNPGPAKGKGKPKFPCGECSKPVKKNQDAILFSSCDTWSHAKMSQLNPLPGSNTTYNIPTWNGHVLSALCLNYRTLSLTKLAHSF